MKRRWAGLAGLVVLMTLLTLTGCALVERVAVSAPPEDYVPVEDGFRYSKSLLSPQEQAVYDALLPGLKAGEERISGLYPDNAMITAAVQAIDRDYPELFWFSGNGSIETTLFADTPLSATYCPEYTIDETERATTQQQINTWTSTCLTGLPTEGGDFEKALYLFEYLVAHADYQETADNSMANIMVNGAGLCGCYAKTMQYLLTQVGIPCAYVTGTADGARHAWNLVWLDGNPTWMDPTWGDPVLEDGHTGDFPSYEYFSLTDEDLSKKHELDDKFRQTFCTSVCYNPFTRYGWTITDLDFQSITDVLAVLLSSKNATFSFQVKLGSDSDTDQALSTILYHLPNLLFSASQDTGVWIDPTKPIRYRVNEDFGVVTVMLGT